MKTDRTEKTSGNLPLTLYLLRHAETAYNADRLRIGGRSPQLPLSENGRMQAAACGKQLAAQCLTFDRVFCSTAKRTVETLQLIQAAWPDLTPLPPIYSDRLQELSQGAWEGRLREEIYTPARLQEINSNNWLFKAPGGESQQEVEYRMMDFIDTEIAARHTSGRFLIVGHGCTFKCLLRGVLGSDPADTYKMKIGNCELIRLVYTEEKKWVRPI
ncbi:MAG: histidine phosphatase family protein [Bacteroidales bacterium]|nr:histidine phosphatase family protein [Bacteroidales bacterium]